jgi:isoleucyl-tRNA synthetase
MGIVRKIVEASNAARAEKTVKLKYTLPSLTVNGTPDVVSAAKRLSSVLASLANVKQVKFGAVRPDYGVKPNWSVAGKKYGPRMKQIAVDLEKSDVGKLRETLKKAKKVSVAGVFLSEGDLLFTEKFPEGMAGMDFAGGSETSEVSRREKTGGFFSGKVLLDTSATELLKEEWLVRELIRAVQETRKKMGLKMKNRVTVYLPGEPAFKKHAKQIALETGSNVKFASPAGTQGELEFEGKKYQFGVKK